MWAAEKQVAAHRADCAPASRPGDHGAQRDADMQLVALWARGCLSIEMVRREPPGAPWQFECEANPNCRAAYSKNVVVGYTENQTSDMKTIILVCKKYMLRV